MMAGNKKNVRAPLAVNLSLLIALCGVAAAHSPHHVISDVVVSPGENSDKDVFLLIADQLFRSDSRGAEWKNLVRGLSNQFEFTSIALSANYETDGTLYASTAGDGVFRSIDRGDSWQAVNAGIADRNIQLVSIVADRAGERYLLAAAAAGGLWRLGIDEVWRIVLTEGVRLTQISNQSVPDQFVYAGDTEGQIWRSMDGGRLWEIVADLPGSGSVTSVAVSGKLVFAGTSARGLYHSNDNGESFERVEGFGPARRYDCQSRELEDPRSDLHVTSIDVLPRLAEAARVFVTTWHDGVFVSDDLGVTWSHWNEGLTCDEQADTMQTSHFKKVIVDAAGNGSPVYWLATFDGLFRARETEGQWAQLETLPLGLIKGMAVTKGAKDVAIALATYGGGFYLTEDRGQRWTIGNQGLQTTRLTGLAFSPHYQENGVVYGGASRRLLRSADSGKTWERIELRQTSFARSLRNKLRNWGMPSGWLGGGEGPQVYPSVLIASPNGGDGVIISTRFHGVLKYDHRSTAVDYVWTDTNKNINTMAMSPAFASDRTLLASIRGDGVIRSADGGKTWSSSNEGLNFVDRWNGNPDGENHRRDVVVSISPDFASDQTVFAGSPAGDGLFVSRNSGESWMRIAALTVRENSPVLAISLSPEFASDRTILISVKGSGLLRSVDGGESFHAVGSGLYASNASIEWLAFSPDYVLDRTVVAASDENLFISESGGESWFAVDRPVRYEDMRDVVTFSGTVDRSFGERFSAMTETRLSGSGSTASLRFVGNGVRWIGSREELCGTAAVFVDGQRAGTVNCAAAEPANRQSLFELNGLTFGAHDLEIRVDSGGGDQYVNIDAFDVLQDRSAIAATKGQ